MSKNLWWKILLIVVPLGLSVAAIYPPKDKIALGLDLRGGAHILMQIDTGSAIAYSTDLAQTRVGQALKDAKIAYAAVTSPAPGTLKIEGVDPARSADVRQVLEVPVGEWSLSGSGGNFTLEMPLSVQQAQERLAIESTLDTLRTRVDGLGVREAVVQPSGQDRVLVLLPGVEDPDRVKGILQDPAVLEWKKVVYPQGVADFRNWRPPATREDLLALFGGALPPGVRAFPETRVVSGGTVTEWWPLGESVVIGKDITNAQRQSGQWGGNSVGFQLSKDAGRRFEAATREYMGKHMAILLGSAREESKRVVSAPTINGIINDRGEITGSFTLEQAEDLALKLRSGAIPADVRIIEERTVGPSLGRDSIRKGVLSGVIGFLAVMVFMLVYYRLSGLNAVIALALNVPLLLGAMAYFGASLSLPGIAGLILTLGMAVDANVLIFERIREELRLGKTVRQAVDLGFSRAFMTIIDCHITTLVSAFFLFSYGTGPVKGFAVSLSIGIVVSMFTAVFVSRVIYRIVLGEGRPVEALSI
ncbi:MAG TPA: protein translocase subunit SecD [Candidatus Polarisedimenticolaceae bacterium]|nr:protein translocase subunit SecD [Candidatus Polarisedimenticolaceae bacterium]